MARVKIIAAIALFTLRGCVPVERFIFRELSPEGAANFAANLANEECQKLCKRRPFSPGSYRATFRDNRWYWGKFDPAGVHGYSAEVSFRKDGGAAKVEVFFSSDKLEPFPPEDMRKGGPREPTPFLEEKERLIFPPEIIAPEFPRR